MELIIFFGMVVTGVVLCAVGLRAAAEHWHLPWREALHYFGLAEHPELVDRRARRRY